VAVRTSGHVRRLSRHIEVHEASANGASDEAWMLSVLPGSIGRCGTAEPRAGSSTARSDRCIVACHVSTRPRWRRGRR
jgi:hypothetical protein